MKEVLTSIVVFSLGSCDVTGDGIYDATVFVALNVEIIVTLQGRRCDMAERNWSRTGEGIVNSSADFIGGVGSAFKGIGNRFKRKKFEPFAEALCAVIGDVASQNGRLYLSLIHI